MERLQGIGIGIKDPMTELVGHRMKGIMNRMVIHGDQQFLKTRLVLDVGLFSLSSGPCIDGQDRNDENLWKNEHFDASGEHPAGSQRLRNVKDRPLRGVIRGTASTAQGDEG